MGCADVHIDRPVYILTVGNSLCVAYVVSLHIADIADNVIQSVGSHVQFMIPDKFDENGCPVKVTHINDSN